MSDLPRMPGGDAGPEGPGPDALVQFHLTGEGVVADLHALRPALTPALLGPEQRWRSYPLVLFDAVEPPEGGRPVVPLSALIARALEAMSQGGATARILTEQVPRLARAVEQALNHGGAGEPLRDVFAVARERFVGEFALSDAGAVALREEIDKLQAALPESGTVLAPGWRAMFELYAAALRRQRRPHEARFLSEVRRLATHLTDLLQIDTSHGPEGTSSGTLSGELGDAGNGVFDTQALARLLPAHRGSVRLTAERRARVEQARTTLLSFLEQAPTATQLVIVHAGAWPADLALPGVEAIEAANALERVAAVFDERAASMAALFRAARIARLEIDGAYEPERHDRALARFDWRSMSSDELSLFPRVTVLERAAQVRRSGVAALFDLLSSGRPVHALLLERPLLRPANDLGRPHLEIGHLAAACREAFVLQSTLAQPEHLDAGFTSMAGSPRPAVAVVAVPSDDSELPPPVELAAAHEARATPCFRFDPGCGDTWADGFDVDANPQVEAAWPVHELRFLNERGDEVSRPEAFTYAHAASLEPAFGCHFQRVPPQHWSDSQVEIADYLALDPAGRHRKLPFIWTVDDDRRLARVVMTHVMAEACRDRLKSWRIFRELAGVHNPHVRRAVLAARLDAASQADDTIRKLKAAHEEELARVRETSAGEAMERLVHVLMDIESAPGAAPLPALEAPPVATEPAQAPVETPPAAEEAEEEESLSFADPYIDAPLCTTCNECTNLNSRMFQYNENKQAFLADASAGTFEQLVKAAEKCPARCIHPGAPRAGDATVTDALVARAAKFN